MATEKTAMQQLKVIVQEMINHGGDDDLLAVITHIDNHLKKEETQICNAYRAGCGDNGFEQTCEDLVYYQRTYVNENFGDSSFEP